MVKISKSRLQNSNICYPQFIPQCSEKSEKMIPIFWNLEFEFCPEGVTLWDIPVYPGYDVI
ncbi:MAG: hypothetical protein EA359_01945 [Balneolaceae bacterium]|nr:MAG: hypothetical protein EA359_01945 [Balneolaceae bacterium]